MHAVALGEDATSRAPAVPPDDLRGAVTSAAAVLDFLEASARQPFAAGAANRCRIFFCRASSRPTPPWRVGAAAPVPAALVVPAIGRADDAVRICVMEPALLAARRRTGAFNGTHATAVQVEHVVDRKRPEYRAFSVSGDGLNPRPSAAS